MNPGPGRESSRSQRIKVPDIAGAKSAGPPPSRFSSTNSAERSSMVNAHERGDIASDKTLDEDASEMCALEEEVLKRLPKWVKIMITMLNEAKEKQRRRKKR